MADEALSRLDTLLTVALRLARTAPSGRVALAQVTEAIELEWIPTPWGEPIIAELEAATEAALQPVPAGRIERILRDAWGSKPTDELDELDTEPERVTPVAQVHRGVLEGQPVAVKVLRPGLANSVRQDLMLLEGLAGPLASAFPALDVAAVLSEVRERVLDDLDLESQAGVQRRFHRALRDHPLFTVPAPVMRLAHSSVVVSEWIDGTPLLEAPSRDEAAARLILFALGAARWGTVHADLSPLEVLSLPDGRVAVVDFGATAHIERRRVDLSADLVEAFIAGDQPALAGALEALGVIGREHAPAAEELVRHALGELGEPAPSRLDSAAVIAARDRMFSRPDLLLELIVSGTLPPEDLWPARGLAQLFASIARAGATQPWPELVRLGLREGWEAQLPS